MAEKQEIYKNHGPVEFLIGKNKCLLLSYRSYLYKRINGNFPKTTWTCKTGCSANVKTFHGVFQSAIPDGDHSHPPVIEEILVIKTNMRIKHRVETEFNLTPRQIHTEERMQLKLQDENDAHLQLESYISIRSNLYKYRQATFPKAPKLWSEIMLTDKWRLTLDESEDFLLVNDGIDDRILIFGTQSNLKILCDANFIVSDGTFSIHPKMFKQLYVFHGPYLGKVIPLLFCLLPDKTYSTYCRLLFLIKKAASQLDMTFDPPKVHIDFELSMIMAVKSVFSCNRVQGCLFHFSQCIWRKVQDLGFAEVYKHNRQVRKWVRRFSGLPFLPVADIDDGFIAIHESAPCPSIDTISSQQIEKFHDYMLSTWVHDSEAIYDRSIWNHFQNDGPRTTNNAEGWNHKVNQQAKSRLGFFQFIHFLQRVQVDLDATKFDLISESPNRQLRKYQKMNELIKTAKQNYQTGSVPILSYLDSVSIALKLD